MHVERCAFKDSRTRCTGVWTSDDRLTAGGSEARRLSFRDGRLQKRITLLCPSATPASSDCLRRSFTALAHAVSVTDRPVHTCAAQYTRFSLVSVTHRRNAVCRARNRTRRRGQIDFLQRSHDASTNLKTLGTPCEHGSRCELRRLRI